MIPLRFTDLPLRSLTLTTLVAVILGVMPGMPQPLSAATLTVTDLGDTGAPGQLRKLINDASPGDTIIIPAGMITLSGPFGEDANTGGDLDISKSLTIQGAGTAVTILDGGGIDRVIDIFPSSAVNILNVRIRGGNPFAHLGGGIRNLGTLTLTNVTVSGNSSGTGGGGIGNTGTLTLTNVTLSGNSAQSGGGMFSGGGGTASLTNVTLSGNTAQFGGGIGNTGTLTLTNVTLSGNSAVNGGGMRNEIEGTAALTNVTVSGNTGAGIVNAGTLTLTNVTLSSNHGGGIFQLLVGSATLKNTLVVNSPLAINCSGVIGSAGHNLSSDTTCAFSPANGDLVNIDPKLGPLQNNGGLTQTHALLPSSAAIDAGSNIGCAPTDQRGVARPQDGNDDGTALCDIGAYEAVTPSPFVTRLYHLVLGREPEAGGVEGWVEKIHEDASVVPTVIAFFHSAEFLSRNTSNEEFLTILYRTFLNREPDSDGFTAFLADLAGECRTRDNLLDIFISSDEFKAQASFLPPLNPLENFVTNLYVRILGRGPDQTGLQGFVTKLQQDFSVLPTVQLFLASPEFLARNTTNTEFVTLLYRVFLDRVPDCQGLASFVAALTQGVVSRDQLLAQFAASPEFKVIERALFPLPNLAGTWNTTLGLTLSNCGNPGNNQSVTLPGIIEWTQSDATIQTTFFLGFTSGAVAQVTLTGTIAPNGQFSGTFAGSISAIGAQLSGTFVGSLTGNTFSLQSSGQFTAGERCAISGSISGTRQ